MFLRGDLVGLKRTVPTDALARRVSSDAALQWAFSAASTSALTYRELVNALLTAGFAASGAGALVTGSPAVRRVGRNRYVLRQHGSPSVADLG